MRSRLGRGTVDQRCLGSVEPGGESKVAHRCGSSIAGSSTTTGAFEGSKNPAPYKVVAFGVTTARSSRPLGWSAGRLVGWSAGRLVGWSAKDNPLLPAYTGAASSCVNVERVSEKTACCKP